jgi:hypothetical protein
MEIFGLAALVATQRAVAGALALRRSRPSSSKISATLFAGGNRAS